MLGQPLKVCARQDVAMAAALSLETALYSLLEGHSGTPIATAGLAAGQGKHAAPVGPPKSGPAPQPFKKISLSCYSLSLYHHGGLIVSCQWVDRGCT